MKIFRKSLVYSLLFVLCTGLAHSANTTIQGRGQNQRASDLKIATRLRSNGECRKTPQVILCIEPVQLTAAEASEFFALVTAGAVAIRLELGKNLDLPGTNNRAVEIFVAKDSGYAHTTGHVEPWVFIPPAAIKMGQAPYLHEMVHAMAQWSWRKSEWFAEGYANHMAAIVAAKHGGYHRSFVLSNGLTDLPDFLASPEGAAMLPLLGVWGRRHTYQGADKALFERLQNKRPTFAPPYYAMSWSFVNYLITTIGVDAMREVVASDAPEKQLLRRTQNGLQWHLHIWLKAQGTSKP